MMASDTYMSLYFLILGILSDKKPSICLTHYLLIYCPKQEQPLTLGCTIFIH